MGRGEAGHFVVFPELKERVARFAGSGILSPGPTCEK